MCLNRDIYIHKYVSMHIELKSKDIHPARLGPGTTAASTLTYVCQWGVQASVVNIEPVDVQGFGEVRLESGVLLEHPGREIFGIVVAWVW